MFAFEKGIVAACFMKTTEEHSISPSSLHSGREEKEVGCATRQVRRGKVGLLWREMAIYVAGNGVGRFDIFIALKAKVTFSTKQND